MTINALLNRLEGVKERGQGRWVAKCPAHNDRLPSLSIRELSDGKVLIHCFAGCSVDEVCCAVGLDVNELFPCGRGGYEKSGGRSFPASDVLRCVAFEAIVVLTAAEAVVSGAPLSAEDRARLSLAVGRMQSALMVVEGG